MTFEKISKNCPSVIFIRKILFVDMDNEIVKDTFEKVYSKNNNNLNIALQKFLKRFSKRWR